MTARYLSALKLLRRAGITSLLQLRPTCSVLYQLNVTADVNCPCTTSRPATCARFFSSKQQLPRWMPLGRKLDILKAEAQARRQEHAEEEADRKIDAEVEEGEKDVRQVIDSASSYSALRFVLEHHSHQLGPDELAMMMDKIRQVHENKQKVAASLQRSAGDAEAESSSSTSGTGPGPSKQLGGGGSQHLHKAQKLALELVDLLRPHWPSASALNLITCMWALDKLGYQGPATSQLVNQLAVSQQLGTLWPADIVRCLGALTRSRIRSERLLQGLCDAAQPRLTDFSPVDLTTLMWCLGKQRYRHPSLLRAATAQAKRTAGRGKLQVSHLALIMWSCARLNHRDDAFIEVVSSLASLHSALYRPPDIPHLLAAYGQLGVSHEGVFNRATQAATPHLKRYSPRELVNIAWACAATRYRSSTFTPLLLAQVSPTVPRLSQMDMCRFVYATGLLQFPVPRTLQEVLQRIRQDMRGLVFQEIADLLYGLAYAGIFEEDIFVGATDIVFQRLQNHLHKAQDNAVDQSLVTSANQEAPGWVDPPHHWLQLPLPTLPLIVEACARMNFKQPHLLDRVADMVAEQVHKLQAAELVALLKALTHFSHRHEQLWGASFTHFSRWLQTAVQIQDLQDLGLVAYGLRLLGPPAPATDLAKKLGDAGTLALSLSTSQQVVEELVDTFLQLDLFHTGFFSSVSDRLAKGQWGPAKLHNFEPLVRAFGRHGQRNAKLFDVTISSALTNAYDEQPDVAAIDRVLHACELVNYDTPDVKRLGARRKILDKAHRPKLQRQF